MLDRYLALCEHAGVDVTICLNKIDLGQPDDITEAAALYERLGYTVIHTSATTGAGLDALRQRLAGRVSLLTGPSGVGKSSLINVILPGAELRTSEISEATGKGRHTTTGVRLLPLPGGGWLADSAGIRELALWNVPADDLARAFVELRPYLDQCEYEDCEHGEGEEGCALRRALAEGAIAPERFASFERLLVEAHEGERPAWEQ
jgi:ribosome biogenesis GTPase